MKAAEFLRKVKRLGRRKGVSVVFNPKPGKGSHGTLFYGTSRTILKDLNKEVGKGLLREMCSNLGINPSDL